MWITPLHVKPFQYVNTKPSKVVCIDLEDVRTLIRKDNRVSKKTEPTVNQCQWIKTDGAVCCAKLKNGNKYCLRHMKMVK